MGSLGVNGGNAAVSDVQVTQCTFNQTMNGARIKTWPVYSFFLRFHLISDIDHLYFVFRVDKDMQET